MKRKYDLRNKRNFIIVALISVLIIGIFSFFIYKFIKLEKVEYKVEAGSVLFDQNKELIALENDAILKTKWNNNYYLTSQKKEIMIGKHAIIFNSDDNILKLYGKYYEVKDTEEIVITDEETIIKNTALSKFYKLSDRKYLIVDKKITSSDGVLNTSNYLLVELDKQGNAKLTNNKVNLKTLSKTIIVSSSFEFDIANEILKYNDKEIDLKKIIGTTNLYNEDNSNSNKGNDNDMNNSTEDDNNQTGVTNNGNVINTNTGGNVINNNEKTDDSDKEENDNNSVVKSTVTSVVGINSSLTYISVDYVIYDPYNKYISNYVEVYDMNGKYINKFILKENTTNLIIDDLNVNTAYSLHFKNSFIENDTIKEQTFYNANVITKSPQFSVGINKVSLLDKTLTYKVYLDNNYLKEIGTGNVSVKVKLLTENSTSYDNLDVTVSTNKIPKYVSGKFSLPILRIGEVVTVEVVEVNVNGNVIKCNNVYYKYVNG